MFKLFGGGSKETAPGKRVELDVREQLRNKQEPFQLIMDTVKTLQKGDTFVLHATFKPTPLLGLMKVKGFTHELEQLEKDHWVVTFRHKSNKEENAEDGSAAGETAAPAGAGQASANASSQPGAAANAAGNNASSTSDAAANADGENAQPPQAAGKVYELDNRGLEPPNPMIRTLNKLEQAKPGDIVRIHNDRVPMFLIEELNTLGYPFEVEEQPDGSAKVAIHKR